MVNTRLSPLYFFVKSQLQFSDRRGVGMKNIKKASDTIKFILDNCCKTEKHPPTKSAFLQIFYFFLKDMSPTYDKYKLIKVKALLDKYLSAECCGGSTPEPA